MIEPTDKDISRRVRLPLFNHPDYRGVLQGPMTGDAPHASQYAMVLFDGDTRPIASACAKLEWDDEEK